MKHTRGNHIAYLGLSAFVGWAAFTAIFAGYVFVLSLTHDHVSEIGAFGFFFVFNLSFSACYLVDFLLLTVPCYLFLLPRFPRVQSWLWSLCGSALFALSVPVWNVAISSFNFAEIFFEMFLALVAGFAAFFVLSPSFYKATETRLSKRSN